jgi:5S rRNA maturation endonuclease (ribonuclease M5)
VGVKDNFRFRQPDLLKGIMAEVDARSVLERLGIPPALIKINGEELVTLCPDHHLYVGHPSSDPKWSLNLKTGQCKCRTEPRGSNFVFTVARLRKCSPSEAVEWMIGSDGAIDLKALELKGLTELPDDVRLANGESSDKKIVGLQSVIEESNRGFLSTSALSFFMKPPGKAPTNITKETLRHYGAFERTWGQYHDRIVIPYHFRGEVVGCVAIDKWGQKDWLRRNPMRSEKDYKKVLFLGGMETSKILFGFDDVKVGCQHLIITEAAREVMKLFQEGYPNSVALSGVSLSGEHIRLIAELSPKSIVVMLDGDKAGRRASKKIAEKLKNTFDVRIASPDEGVDPKMLEKKDFKMLIRNANKVADFS